MLLSYKRFPKISFTEEKKNEKNKKWYKEALNEREKKKSKIFQRKKKIYQKKRRFDREYEDLERRNSELLVELERMKLEIEELEKYKKKYYLLEEEK